MTTEPPLFPLRSELCPGVALPTTVQDWSNDVSRPHASAGSQLRRRSGDGSSASPRQSDLHLAIAAARTTSLRALLALLLIGT